MTSKKEARKDFFIKVGENSALWFALGAEQKCVCACVCGIHVYVIYCVCDTHVGVCVYEG